MSDLTPVSAQPITLSENPAAVYLSRLSSKSRRTQHAALETIAQLTGQHATEFVWAQLRYQHTAAIRAYLAEKYAPATANRILSAMRGVLKEAWRLGQIDAETYQRACDVTNIKSQTLPAGRALTQDEMHRLMQACLADASPAGVRDAAMLAILRAGLRRSEVVKLDLADFDPATGQLSIREGKGRKDRTAYVAAGAIGYVANWITVRGIEAGALLHPIDLKGRIQPRRLTDQAVLVVLQKRAKQAGISQHFSCHDWRRTFATDLLNGGVDIETVSKLMGHSNIQTTARYSRRGEDVKRKAADLLGF